MVRTRIGAVFGGSDPTFSTTFCRQKKAPLMAPFWDLCWTVIVTDQSSRKLRRWSERVG